MGESEFGLNIGDMDRHLLATPFLITGSSGDDTSLLTSTRSDNELLLFAGDFGFAPDCVSFSID